MRELLFRGKSTETNQWIYGGFHIWEKRQVCALGDDRLKDDEISYVITVNSFADWNMPRAMQAVEVIADTVGQYTGLTDVNGKKIFEGDIVKSRNYRFVVRFGKCSSNKFVNYNNGYIGFYLEPFDEETKSYGLRDDICYFDNLSVIGNIYDLSTLNAEKLDESEE